VEFKGKFACALSISMNVQLSVFWFDLGKDVLCINRFFFI